MLTLTISLTLLLFGIILVRKCSVTPSVRVLILLLVMAGLIFSGFYLGIDYFTGCGINESVIYQFTVGFNGAGFGAYKTLIAASSFLLFFASFTVYILNRSLKSTPLSTKLAGRHRLALLFLLLALGINPTTTDIFSLIADWNLSPQLTTDQNPTGAKSEFQKFYKKPEALLPPNAPHLNLVLIYLEGLERTYFDEKVFPGLITHLRELEKRALSFTNIHQLWGTGWTIAGMTASQLGIPLAITSDYNSMGGMDSFLPEAVGLGDILHNAGYKLEYLGGAASKFAGKGKFYLTHGFSSVKGRDELLDQIANPEYHNWWGLYDDSLFDLFYKRFAELSAGEKPFGLCMITLDTHHPDGCPSQTCSHIKYGDGTNKMLNAVAGADCLVSNFINKILSSPYKDNTIICVASDHLARKSSAWDLLQKCQRRDLLMIFAPQNLRPRKISRAGSTLDTGATLLHLLGGDDKLGLGRNLLNSKIKTLIEAVADPDQQLKKWRNQLISFWQFPTIDAGIFIEPGQDKITIGGRTAQLPALIELNRDLKTKTIKFAASGSLGLAAHIVHFTKNQPFIWIDKCSEISALQTQVVTTATNGLCIYAGRLGAKNQLSLKINQPASISFSQLKNAFSGPVSEILASSRKSSLTKNILQVTNLHDLAVADSVNGLSEMALRSCGGPLPESAIISLDLNPVSFPLKRGISLIGLSATSKVTQLAHLDLYANPEDLKTQVPFFKIINQHQDDYKIFVVMVADTAFNTSVNLDHIFNSTPLTRWKFLNFRQPYIGVILPKNRSFEVLGAPESSIGVKFILK